MRGLISSLYFLFVRALWTYPNGKQQKTGAEKSQRQIMAITHTKRCLVSLEIKEIRGESMNI